MNAKWHEMLSTEIYQNNLFGVVTDEAHVIPKWGQNDKKEKRLAFRECFGRLGELRSILPGAPVLALTATVTKKIKKNVTESLSLKKDMVLIDANPNWPNIYLSVKKISNDLNSSFQWLVEKLKKEMNTMDRVLIYCKTIKDCGRIFTYFKCKLGSDAYYPAGTEQISINMLVGMYHHSTLQKHKERIINSLHDMQGVCRIIIATNALGMGVNFRNIRTVIHYGPPRQMDDFIQEIGRAGKCDTQMKLYASNIKRCLREILLAEFESLFTPHDTPHNCCTVCHKIGSCLQPGQCSVIIETDLDFLISSSPEERSRVVTAQQKRSLRELLLEMKQHIQLNDKSYYLSADSSTGFTASLIDLVVKNYVFDDIDIPEIDTYGSEADGELLTMYNLEYGGEYIQDTEKLSDYTSDIDVTDLSVMSDIDE
ncbi:Werner syndrome ATP-dependent helicase-like [Paramuricea clavata]|uniref:DNA 3'-5' helicase n=1 Tax=Paramuricea clavata TaxID=317549 RepID=A0A6S7I862_PARCT|nr:Werner syndrome ATP-dependent helicase-like [Paramuricea clavata]